MIVHKFGGTSVGDAGCIDKVTEIVIGQHRTSSNGTAVVVSAMSGVTDQLIAGARAAERGEDDVYRDIKSKLLGRHLQTAEALLAPGPQRDELAGLIRSRLDDLERFYRSIHELGECTLRGSDAVASFGEPLSAAILAAVLRERGAQAQAVSATELIVTDDNFGAARPLTEKTNLQLVEHLTPMLARGVIPVITGFIAANERGVTTTLGRGGSDYTAAIVGAGLGADEVWIWSDVDGILTADPNLVPLARTLAELSYAEAAELAYYGADVLHPKTIQPVIEAGIPLRILNTFKPSHAGTLIVKTPGAGRKAWPAIISTTGLNLIAIGSRDDSWKLGQVARALHVLSEAGVDVPLFSQSYSEHSLNLVVQEHNQSYCLNVLRREFGDDISILPGDEPGTATKPGKFSLDIKERVATVSVVGIPGWNGNGNGAYGGIVQHAFAALGKHGTRVIAVAQAGTEYSVSFCIPDDQVEGTVRFLHHELGLEKK